jgi:putative peptide zinc metalloprotease protein
MSAVIDQAAAGAPICPSPSGQLTGWPRLLDGTELIGQAAGSGLREPPYLVRRCDGQVVQLSQLLYVLARHMDGRDLDTIAESASSDLQLRVSPQQTAHAAEYKLAPLGLVAYRDGSTAKLERRNAMLGLRFRAAIVPERAVNVLARLFGPLFLAPIVVAALAALVACDAWLASAHELSSSLQTVIRSPVLVLLLFAVVIVSLAFHECGHAAACRYGGARPGRIGVGIYIVWPVFYTDVTDSWRLSRRGRLRTDLGGVYFNVLFALSAAGAFLVTSYKPLLIVVVSQQLLLLDQFMPWIRLDGYHVVSDLIGVSDLFERIKPVIASLRPGREPDRRVSELKPWARAAVTTWVLTTLAALLGVVVLIVLNAASYLERGWQSLLLQLDAVAAGARTLSAVGILTGVIGTILLLLPILSIALSYLLLCRGLGTGLALRRSRVDPTLAERSDHSSIRLLVVSRQYGRVSRSVASSAPAPRDTRRRAA